MEDIDFSKYSETMGRAARRTLEKVADDIGLNGEQREEMLKCNPITVSVVRRWA